MYREYIKKLNKYKELIIECKKVQILKKIEEDIENKIPTTGKPKQKILSLYR